MKLLLTNDDGWNADGIQILFGRLKACGHDVAICAPDRNRSAASSRIVVERPMTVKPEAPGVFSCSGYPSDCVIVALRGTFLPFVPDAVISGINRGANLGTDIIYSGPAAAARQAVLYGVPGVAVSLDSHDPGAPFDALADFTATNVERLVALSLPGGGERGSALREGIFVNVNAQARDAYTAAVCTDELSFREYRDSVDIVRQGDVFEVFCRGGETVSHGSADNDAAISARGEVAITRVYARPLTAEKVDVSAFSV